MVPHASRLPFLSIRVRGIFSYLLAMKWIISIPMYHQLSNSGQGGELVAMFEEDLDLEFGIGRVVIRTARGKRFAVLGHGERIDGKEHEEIIVTQRGHDGPFIELQAHSDGLAVESRA